MFVVNAVTDPCYIVNLFTFENMDKEMWKYQMIKHDEEIKRQEIQSIMELPRYAAFVRKHENLWQKSRKDFTELEKEFIGRKYIEMIS
ncbi:MAG: hypothetical protein ACRCX2_32400 [Paraclostridium sp.]